MVGSPKPAGSQAGDVLRILRTGRLRSRVLGIFFLPCEGPAQAQLLYQEAEQGRLAREAKAP